MNLVLKFSREDLSNLQTAIIVENWDRVKEGRGRRRYLAEFTERERNYIAKMYKNFYRWYLVTGYPDNFTFHKVESIELIKKAVNFFAEV